jgi:Ser/Thr protein kinase RdoA (MazF antagonist)
MAEPNDQQDNAEAQGAVGVGSGTGSVTGSGVPTGSAGASSGSSMGSAGAPPTSSGMVAAAGSGGASHRAVASATATAPRPSDRDRFETYELGIVLSHYDIGVIESIQDYPRGSRRSPKLLLRSDSGTYLLKRRASRGSDPYKVAFCHSIQLYLAAKQFPLPHLIGTKKDNNSMLQCNGAIYEIFEYIKGTPYDNSIEATLDAGKILALYHKLLADFQPEYETARGSYHGSRQVIQCFDLAPQTLARIVTRSAKDVERIKQVVGFLKESYLGAAKYIDDQGFPDWPQQIVHADWHPGNMLYRGSRVVAVIDYDTARVQQRVLDVGNGSLQFAILGGGDDAATWPENLDEERFKRFLRGYEVVPDCVLSQAELQVVPHLMIEALIAESIIPIATTGYFARMEGFAFLNMVERKVRWLQKHAQRLPTLVGA